MPSPTMDDLRTIPHDDVLADDEKRSGRVLDRDNGHYSRYNGTAGFPTSEGTWVRLAWCRPGQLSTAAWTGIEASVAITGVPRPEWYAGAQWHDAERGVVWRVDEMSRGTDPAVSATGTVDQDPPLPSCWWTELRAALDTLAGHDTDRVCMRQEHLTGRIREVYGDTVDTTITAGPARTATSVWSASLTLPTLAAQVLAEFHDVLDTRPGRLSRLMLCANVERPTAARARRHRLPRRHRKQRGSCSPP
ncbi:aminoglycoside phosphotransferase [Streptomyces sp. NPDC046876]|uniref:aminoglycoside phosphotransferase n=1 Tax=Streptomyces sp. NPDC046876 TaxID=3155616 RepID=UPI0033E38493